MRTHRRARGFGLAGALLSAVLPTSGARAADAPPPRLVDKIHAEGDFIDDPFAIAADGSRIAWITTDGATHAAVHLGQIGKIGAGADHKSASAFPYGSITPERVEFLDGARVLVVDRNPQTGFARGEVFGPAGAAREKFGPATDIALGTVSGTPAIVVYLRTGGSGAKGAAHTLTAFRRDTLKPLGKKVFVEGADGRVALPGGPGKPLFFEHGYTILVAQKEGAFDKEARLDVWSGKIVLEREVKDPVALVQLSLMRKKHQGEAAFVRFSDDLRRLELVDDSDAIGELTPPRPLGKYDPQTLAWQVDPADRGALDLSLTIDPVNPEAVKAQKADKDWLDVYHLDVKTKALVEIARVDGEKRPTAWRFAAGRLGVLRKHKGFGRGGADLEIFEVGEEKKAPPPPAAPLPKAGAPDAKAGGDKAPATAKPASTPPKK